MQYCAVLIYAEWDWLCADGIILFVITVSTFKGAISLFSEQKVQANRHNA